MLETLGLFAVFIIYRNARSIGVKSNLLHYKSHFRMDSLFDLVSSQGCAYRADVVVILNGMTPNCLCCMSKP